MKRARTNEPFKTLPKNLQVLVMTFLSLHDLGSLIATCSAMLHNTCELAKQSRRIVVDEERISRVVLWIWLRNARQLRQIEVSGQGAMADLFLARLVTLNRQTMTSIEDTSPKATEIHRMTFRAMSLCSQMTQLEPHMIPADTKQMLLWWPKINKVTLWSKMLVPADQRLIHIKTFVRFEHLRSIHVNQVDLDAAKWLFYHFPPRLEEFVFGFRANMSMEDVSQGIELMSTIIHQAKMDTLTELRLDLANAHRIVGKTDYWKLPNLNWFELETTGTCEAKSFPILVAPKLTRLDWRSNVRGYWEAALHSPELESLVQEPSTMSREKLDPDTKEIPWTKLTNLNLDDDVSAELVEAITIRNPSLTKLSVCVQRGDNLDVWHVCRRLPRLEFLEVVEGISVVRSSKRQIRPKISTLTLSRLSSLSLVTNMCDQLLMQNLVCPAVESLSLYLHEATTIQMDDLLARFPSLRGLAIHGRMLASHAPSKRTKIQRLSLRGPVDLQTMVPWFESCDMVTCSNVQISPPRADHGADRGR